MQVFKIRQDGFKEIRNKMLLRLIPMVLVAGAVGIGIGSINKEQTENNVNVQPMIITVAIFASGFGIYLSVRRQKALFESYRFIIADGVVMREQLDTPKISIQFNDIKEIAKHKSGVFSVKGRDAASMIAIPVQVDDYQQLEAALQQIQPIVLKDQVPFMERYQSLAALATVGLMFCVYRVNNKIIVALSGSALVALLVWSFIKIRNSKHLDNKTKRSAWWVVLVLVLVIAVMIAKLTGLGDLQKH